MKKIRLILITLSLLLLTILVLDNVTITKGSQQSQLHEQIYLYMKQEKNKEKVFSAAKDLNAGKSSNACVYFVSEVLRRNNVDIPNSTCNNAQIISLLNKKGWRKDRDYKNLKPGDIVFTTDAKGNKFGTPTHTYVFMGWVKDGSYDYAHIVDNQSKDYEDQIYHIRNIKDEDVVNGITKDAFSFFMTES